MLNAQGKAEICFSLEKNKVGCNSTSTTYVETKEKMELGGVVRVAQ